MDFVVAYTNKREATVARFSSSICLPNNLKSSQAPSQKVIVYDIKNQRFLTIAVNLLMLYLASGTGVNNGWTRIPKENVLS